jgi:hypothetical protein
MRSRPHHLIRNLLTAALTILAAMHPDTAGHLAHLGVGLILAIVQGAADAAADNPGPAVLAAGAVYLAHQIRTHRPRTARAHP